MSVHESFITRTSDFFATALKKAWFEGQTKVIKLPEEDHVHLAYYLDWVYNQVMPTSRYCGRSVFGHPPITLPAIFTDSFLVLAHLYVLGECMLDKVFRDALLNEFILVMNLKQNPVSPTIALGMSPPLQVITIIYQGTTSTSPARRLLVDWCLAFGDKSQYTMLHEKEFVVDIAKSFSDKAERGMASSEFRGVLLRSGGYVV
jgi:hypothetical protein